MKISNLQLYFSTSLVLGILFSTSLCHGSFIDEKEEKPHKNLITVLSIDGGGGKGIIPLYTLDAIEKKAGKPISHLFDIVMGTSIGGVLSLALNRQKPKRSLKVYDEPLTSKTPLLAHSSRPLEIVKLYGDQKQEKFIGDVGKFPAPLYSAEDLKSLFTVENGKKIFDRDWRYKVRSGWGAWSPKYRAEGREKLFKSYLGDTRLCETITNTCVTSYDLDKKDLYLYKSWKAKKEMTHSISLTSTFNESRDWYMWQAAMSTSAAPTYWKPADYKNFQKVRKRTVDGGVVINNPTVSAAIEGKELYPNRTHFLVVSLGCGADNSPLPVSSLMSGGFLSWPTTLLKIFMGGVSHTTDYQMRKLEHIMREARQFEYFRINPHIPPANAEMDVMSSANLTAWRKAGEKAVKDNGSEINKIVSMLKENPRLDKPLPHH